MSIPAEFIRVTFGEIYPTPLIDAIISEPAGLPTVGLTESSFGVRVIPVMYYKSSVPSGIPIGRYTSMLKVVELSIPEIYTLISISLADMII